MPQAVHLKFPGPQSSWTVFNGHRKKDPKYCDSKIWCMIWCIFIAEFDCMSRFLCSLHSEFTLQFTFEGVLQSKTLQVGKFSSLSHRQCQPFLRETPVNLPESGETIFLFCSSRVTRHIYRSFEEMAFNLGVHPLRGQKSFQSVMVGLILKHGYRSKKKKKSPE